MKFVFILDEDVFIQSHICRNIQDTDEDFSSLYLVIKILEECHKIGLTPELSEKYYEKSKILERRKEITNAVKLWRNFLIRKDKQMWCTNHLNDLPPNLEHDRHVIEPALFLQGTLVTTDQKLKERLDAWIREKQLTLNIRSPRDAIAFLSEYEQ